jgi:hypothetical protein
MSSIWDSVVTWDNLWLAYRKAAKGKRGVASTARFDHYLADNLAELQADLTAMAYQPGPYVHFTIHEPKRRKISAAPFRDRVVHHALCNVIEPLFEQHFVGDSYANRVGKGTHRAVYRLQHLAQRYRYVLRMDIVQHFASLDHAVLQQAIAAVIEDDSVLWLVDQILRSGNGVLADEYTMVYFPGDDLFACIRPRGLPIGNLTSQFWSNVYMDQLDWFVTSELGCRSYLRYVDDFALFSDSKRQLWQWKQEIIAFLQHLRLTIHNGPAQVQPVEDGIAWLGFVVYPSHRLVKRRNVVNFSRRFEHLLDLYTLHKISFAEVDASVQGWINHVRFADTWHVRSQLFHSHRIKMRPKLPTGKTL